MPRSRDSVTSLTQWIAVCNCDRIEDSTSQEADVAVCPNCGKRLQEGRQGSFTQWIFRSDLCSCGLDRSKLGDLPPGDREVAEPLIPEQQWQEIELDEPGFPVDRFKPYDILGSGATSTVYLCRDESLDKLVAIKLLEQSTPEQIMAFQMEARVSSRLDHNNIVTILDFGISEAQAPYMVLEYLQGQTLETLIAEYDRLDPAAAIDLVTQIGRGLSHAHDHGILHKDIKPRNVLITGQGTSTTAKILDFGLSALMTNTRDQGRSMIGTPLYMAPEVVSGEKHSNASDIYSLGCVFFELLAGRPPFEADSVLEVMQAHVSEHVPELSELREDLDTEQLQQIIAFALEKNPKSRFASVNEMLEALQEIEYLYPPEESQPQVPAGRSSGAATWMLLAAAGISALAVLTGAYFISRQTVREDPARPAKLKLKEPTLVIKDRAATGDIKFNRLNDGYWFPNDIFQFKDEHIRLVKGKGYPRISFHSTDIDGSGLKVLKGESFDSIVLAGTRVTDDNLKYLADLKNLEELHLSTTGISLKGLRHLARFNMVNLALTNCKNIDDQAVEFIVKTFPNLKALSLTNTSVTDRGIVDLVGLTKLEILHMSNLDSVTDSSLEQLVRAKPPLFRVLINNTPITDKGLESLLKLRKLRELGIVDCKKITRRGMAALRLHKPPIELQEVDDSAVTY